MNSVINNTITGARIKFPPQLLLLALLLTLSSAREAGAEGEGLSSQIPTAVKGDARSNSNNSLTSSSPSKIDLPQYRSDEIKDDQLPGGAAVGAVLRRIQSELDSRTLSQASQAELESLATKYPNNYKVHLYYGLVLDEVGLPEQAMAEYELADKLGPNDPRATAGIMNHVLMRRDAREASVLLDKALKRFPDSPDILFFMGKNFKENKHNYEAQRILLRAYKAGYKIKHLPVELGELFVNSDPARAVKLANEDLAQYPDYYLSLQVKGIALMNQGKFEQAIEPLAKLYKQSPTYSHSAEFYLRCLFWAGRYHEAMQPCLYFLGKEAQTVSNPLASAEVLKKIVSSLSERDVEQQLAEFYAQLKQNKINVKPAFHYYLGSVFYDLGKVKLAKAELEQFLALDPKSVEGLFLYGQLQENCAHNYTEALRVYEIAHALSPFNVVIDKAYTRMEEKQSLRSSDWAAAFRDWLSAIFGLSRLN